MNRIGCVKLSGELVGYITEVGDETTFAYTQDWLANPRAVPISLTLPLRPEPFTHRGLPPFFENLLPEGWMFDMTSRKLKISKEDPFGMLLATCGDCIGQVEIEPVDLVEE